MPLHSPADTAMEEVSAKEAHSRIVRALCKGASADVIRELLSDLRQETKGERNRATSVLCLAMDREADVFQVVLDAMCMEMIAPAEREEFGALSFALMEDRKTAVMAVVERLNREKAKQQHNRPLQALFHSCLFNDEEVVEAVIGVMPEGAFCQGKETDDCLEYALRCKEEHRERAVELCLRLGPAMEERLKGVKRFRYVCIAAEFCDLEMVQKMHDLVPVLSCGDRARGEVADYVNAFWCVSRNCYDDVDVSSVMEYLVEQAGDDVLDQCSPGIVINVRVARDVEWLITRAPQLLEEACKEDHCLRVLVYHKVAEYLMEQIVKLVDPDVITGLMRQPGIGADRRRVHGVHGWRWKLRTLHEGVPECMDGLRWPWMMEAIQEKAYRDVEYMVKMCTREHLVKRNEEGDRAYDAAARDEEFPPHLLDRLKVVTKGAHG